MINDTFAGYRRRSSRRQAIYSWLHASVSTSGPPNGIFGWRWPQSRRDIKAYNLIAEDTTKGFDERIEAAQKAIAIEKSIDGRAATPSRGGAPHP